MEELPEEPFAFTKLIIKEFKKESRPPEKLKIALGTPGLLIADLVFLPIIIAGKRAKG